MGSLVFFFCFIFLHPFMKNIHFLTLRFLFKGCSLFCILLFCIFFQLLLDKFCADSLFCCCSFNLVGCFLLFLFLFSTKFLISAEQFFPEDDFEQLFFVLVVKWEKFSNFKTTKQELKTFFPFLPKKKRRTL